MLSGRILRIYLLETLYFLILVFLSIFDRPTNQVNYRLDWYRELHKIILAVYLELQPRKTHFPHCASE